MTLGLATRGYLAGGASVTPRTYGPGPKIISSEEVKPEIDVADTEEPCTCRSNKHRCRRHLGRRHR